MRQISIPCILNLGLLYLFSFLQPVHGVTLELLPQTQNVTVGDSVVVDVQIGQLGEMESPSVGGFDFDFNYDPAILNFDSLTFSGLIDLSNVGSQLVDASTPGIVSFVDLSILDTAEELNAAQPSRFNLATLNFTSSGVGENSLLSLTIISLLDEMLLDFAPIVPENATLSVEPIKVAVPEPSLNLISWIVFLGLTSIYCKKIVP